MVEGGQAEPPTQMSRRCASRCRVASRCCSSARHTVGTAFTAHAAQTAGRIGALPLTVEM